MGDMRTQTIASDTSGLLCPDAKYGDSDYCHDCSCRRCHKRPREEGKFSCTPEHGCAKEGCPGVNTSEKMYCLYHACYVDNCQQRILPGRVTCEAHACSFSYCPGVKQADSSCEFHTCNIESCTGKGLGKGVCWDHACEMEGCMLPRVSDGSYCETHTCVICTRAAWHGATQYCDVHTCIYPSCITPRNVNEFCLGHGCGLGPCDHPRSKTPSTVLCIMHECVKEGCLLMASTDFSYCPIHERTEPELTAEDKMQVWAQLRSQRDEIWGQDEDPAESSDGEQTDDEAWARHVSQIDEIWAHNSNEADEVEESPRPQEDTM